MSDLSPLLQSLSTNPLLAIALTLVSYQVGCSLYSALNHPAWLPPILSSGIILTALITALGIDYKQYFDGARWISFLLGPATVALAIPLFLQLHRIRSALIPITLTLFIGAPLAAGSAVAIAALLGADLASLLSIAPKSVTAPIAVTLSEQLGGLPSLTVGLVALTGVLVSLAAPLIWRLTKIKDARILGFCMGLNGHGIATAQAFEISPTAGAFSSLAMSLTGTLTALVLPLLAHLI